MRKTAAVGVVLGLVLAGCSKDGTPATKPDDPAASASPSATTTSAGAGTRAAASKHTLGERLLVEWKGKTYVATVHGVVGDKVKIRYDGYTAASDEVVGEDRIKGPAPEPIPTAATPPTATTAATPPTATTAPVAAVPPPPAAPPPLTPPAPPSLPPMPGPPLPGMDFATSYIARLGPNDHVNSTGGKLATAAMIVRQDRANYHSLHKRDPEDGNDALFSALAERERIPEYIDNSELPASVAHAITSGTPLVRVTIFHSRDHSSYWMHVEIVG